MADDTALPTRWDVAGGKNIRWQTPIPGLAHASPIVWGERVYVATAVGPGEATLKIGLYGDIAPADDQGSHQWRLMALDKATGKIIWDSVGHQGVPRVKRHTKASHCNSTPATDGRHIVAIFGSEGLFCFDADGKLEWTKDLGPMNSGFFRASAAQWGFGSSPIIHDGKVMVQCDVQGDSFLTAIDLADGRELWLTPRKDVPTWSTPTVAGVEGKTHILVNGWHHSGAYDFATGKEVWMLTGGGDIPVPTPITANGMVYLTSSHGARRPMRAVRLDAKGDITPAEAGETNGSIVWAHGRLGNYMQTPILVGEHLYGCTDSGVLTCFDAATGVVRYSERLQAGGGLTASPVSDGRHVYFASERGRVLLVPADGKFSIAARCELGDPCMATPAISQGTIFFRTEHKVIAVGGLE